MLWLRTRLQDIIFMLSANLFRALPPSRGADQENYDPDEEEPTLEPTWPHLQVRQQQMQRANGCKYLPSSQPCKLQPGRRQCCHIGQV
jgi:Protein phosphatase 2A regulatory B subunit (B56 family)